MSLTLEDKIQDLYKEFKEKKDKGILVDKRIYAMRKRALELAIEVRDKWRKTLTIAPL